MLIPGVTVGVTKRIISIGSGKSFDFVHLCAKCADFFVLKVFLHKEIYRNVLIYLSA